MRKTHLCCLLAGVQGEHRAEGRLHATLGKAHPATVSSPAGLNQLRWQPDPDLVSTLAASEHAGKTATWQILAVIDSCYQQVPGTVLFRRHRMDNFTSRRKSRPTGPTPPCVCRLSANETPGDGQKTRLTVGRLLWRFVQAVPYLRSACSAPRTCGCFGVRWLWTLRSTGNDTWMNGAHKFMPD